MIHSTVLRALALAACVILFSGCRRERKTGGDFPRSEALYVGGRQWGEPSTFNPLDGNPAWPVHHNANVLLYETLFVFNPLSGKLEPLLGESYTVNDDNIEVVLNAAARWSDGKPVTGWDVKYTFELGQKYKSVPIAPIWGYLTGITLPEEGKLAPGSYPRRVVFGLDTKRKNPLIVLDALQEHSIVPKHVFEPLFAGVKNDINEFMKLKFDKNPVVSGPYTLHSYSSEKIVAVRNPNYWGNQALYGGKLPGPKYIIHPIYKSNDHFSVALQQGRLDASSNFVPRIWLKQKKGVKSWYDKEPFFLTTAMPSLILNVMHKPLDDVQMRRAMGFAINYKDIRELAVSGYSEPLKPGLLMPFGLEAKYYSEEDAQKYGTWYDPERAKAVLKAAGYKPVWGKDGELVETRDAQGKKVPTVYIKSPTGWSDWESIVRIAVRSMREVGIDARERFVDASLFWNALFSADFDLIMQTPSPSPSPSKPWSRFEWTLTTQDFAPEGEKMYKNMGRFNDPKGPNYIARIDELLNIIPTLTNEQELLTAYRELNRIFMEQQPILPLVYRPDQFYEVSTRHWDNFPTAENAYAPPYIPGDRIGTKILWQLKPKLD